MSASVQAADDEALLVSAVIRGSSAYSANDLFETYRQYLGKPITAVSAQAIAANIATRYSNDGYSRPAIAIDDRMTGTGVLVLSVAETRISTVEISGDPGPYADQLRSLGQTINSGELLRDEQLQSSIRRMRDLAGLNLTASTSRDSDLPGAYRLSLDTKFNPVSSFVRLSNRGTDEIGPGFLIGQSTLNGLINGRATLGLLFGTTVDYDEYHGAGLNGGVRLTDRDLQLYASGYRSRSDPTETGTDRDDRYLRDRATLNFSRPLIDSASRRLVLTAGLRAEDLAIDRSGNRLRDERLRVAEITGRWIRAAGSSAQYALTADLAKGFNGMGSGLRADDLSDDPRSADFVLLSMDYIRAARLTGFWSWRLNALGQYSDDVLPYSERFKIGGDRLGRGFEITEIAGDRGIGARFELARQLPALQGSSARAVSVYLSYDLAAAWKNDDFGRESAATGGLGVALNGRLVRSRIELARPLTHADVEGRRDLSLFAELSMSW